MEAKALPGGIGMEVLGLDLGGEIAEATAAELRALWRETGVLLFRGSAASEEALLRLSRCFGTPEPHPIASLRMAEHPELILLSNAEGLRGPVYAYDGVPTYGSIPWHTDMAFEAVPNAGALLRMVFKAEVGGQTAWLDTAAAYEALDEGFRRRLEGVEARFEFCADLGSMRFCNPGGVRVGQSSASFPDVPPIVRPIVWAHPVTGRKVLNLCPLNLRGVVGMDPAEGDALLEELIARVIQPRFVYEHDWGPDDVVLWDNYRMMHRAAGHPVEVIRTVQRSTLRGTATVGRVLT